MKLLCYLFVSTHFFPHVSVSVLKSYTPIQLLSCAHLQRMLSFTVNCGEEHCMCGDILVKTVLA